SWSINNVLQAQVHYDNNGNIVNKSDVNLPGGSYLYNSGNKPHAVHSVTSPTPAFRSASYPQNIEYTAFNKVNSIHPGTGGEDYEITYGTNNQRVKSYTHTWIGKTSRGLPIKTKYYLGDYEIEINHVTKKTRDLHYLHAGDGLFAILVTEGTASNLYYIHKDHLGSYNAITDATGNLVETLSFDPWGRRRNPTNWTYNNMPASFLFDRGYTGHEHLDGFGLINMNGRVYDPFLARFLSPDNFVQAPNYSQNYNRYTYAWNNPLKYTDSDGE
ncbi:MAG: RHS repeat-associated core domain-containing protein, partial [Bacteroidales bacterium]|nr:RHS repeat-associated core domain-containing protein [Bacteroidales bacterium]